MNIIETLRESIKNKNKIVLEIITNMDYIKSQLNDINIIMNKIGKEIKNEDSV